MLAYTLWFEKLLVKVTPLYLLIIRVTTLYLLIVMVSLLYLLLLKVTPLELQYWHSNKILILLYARIRIRNGRVFGRKESSMNSSNRLVIASEYLYRKGNLGTEGDNGRWGTQCFCGGGLVPPNAALKLWISVLGRCIIMSWFPNLILIETKQFGPLAF